jgi:small subunit ribosomal protein S20
MLDTMLGSLLPALACVPIGIGGESDVCQKLTFWESKVATHKQAAKRARQSNKRRIRNTGIRSRVKNTVSAFRESLTQGDKAEAEKAFKEATLQLRRAASKGVLHKRTASRRVSRLTRAHNKLGS